MVEESFIFKADETEVLFMTPPRPVIPELREMPLTFLDCERYFNNFWCKSDPSTWSSCKDKRKYNRCPRGFAP
jgi:hypothetical protein